ncbi:MAG: hypothetical protein EBR82_24250 [Caulobacteraceae bacterium]|nr:hypothetical protein [Caulobacteraceae bacterium]
MASEVSIVGNALVDIINGASLGQSVTAVFTHDDSEDFQDITTARVAVIPTGRTKTMFDRSQIRITQTYAVNVRKRSTSDEMTNGAVAEATLNAWEEFVENLENIQWTGRFSTLGARIDSVETVASYDIQFLKQFNMFAAVISITTQWWKTIT